MTTFVLVPYFFHREAPLPSTSFIFCRFFWSKICKHCQNIPCQFRLYIFTSMVFSNIWWDLAELWMRSSPVGGWDLAEWLERQTANTVVATVLGSIPASSDTVESEGRQMKQCWILYITKHKKPAFFLYIGQLCETILRGTSSQNL